MDEIKRLAQKRNAFENNLHSTNTKAILYLEGLLSEQEYAPIKAQRQALKDEINELEEQIKKLRGQLNEENN